MAFAVLYITCCCVYDLRYLFLAEYYKYTVADESSYINNLSRTEANNYARYRANLYNKIQIISYTKNNLIFISDCFYPQ